MNTTGIWSDKLRLGGKPCIRGHRFSMAQLLAEVAERGQLIGFANKFEFDYDNIKSAWIDLVEQLNLLKINSKYIMSDPETRGGQNCIQGHRIPITLTLTIEEEAHDYDLEKEEVEGVLWDLASLLDRDWTNGPPQDIKKAILEGPT